MDDRFKVDLRGIIDLAAHHLYSCPDVFVRELIQNACDAISARARLAPGFRGSIRLELTPADADASPPTPGRICITDDGIGLTLEEVHTFLSTVGGSSKREDAQAVAEQAAGEGSFLGRFGIGLLSCFMVTDEIVVVTRSARDAAARPIEWRGRADGSYSTRELAGSAPVGTSVYLTCKPEAEEYFQRERLVDLARQYAEMLPPAITVSAEGDEVPINAAQRPWEVTAEDDIGLADLCQHGLGFRPIDAVPIQVSGGVRGWAFIRPDRAPGWGGNHRLYARGMFVSENAQSLIPEWARFVGLILNVDGLPLTASREALQHSDDTAAAKEEIGRAIRKRLVHLLRHDPGRFAAVMAVHDTDIRGFAVKDRDFFASIIDLLEFETTLGPIRFGEFRREHEQLLIARSGEQYRRIQQIAAASGLRIFHGGYTFHEELLAKAAAHFPGLSIEAFDAADLADHLPEPDDAADFALLIAAGERTLDSRACKVCVRSFEPAPMPAFYALGLQAEYHAQLDRTKSMASGLWTEVLDAMAPRPADLPPTRLCLNARCPVVRKLAGATSPEVLETAIKVLYVQALMAGQHPLTAADQATLAQAMEGLLAHSLERRP